MIKNELLLIPNKAKSNSLHCNYNCIYNEHYSLIHYFIFYILFHADECISPYELVAGGCFSFLNTISGTWDEARAVCGTSGGDLAIVNDCNLMAELIKFIQENSEDLNRIEF